MSIKYEVKDPLLKTILFGSSNCKEAKVEIGGWIDSDNILARSLLTYCAQKVFRIDRVPGYQEEDLAQNRFIQQEAFKMISRSEFDSACSELLNLYNTTQNYLHEVTKNDKLELRRSLRDYELVQIKRQLESGYELIKYQSNTITSYSTNGQLGEYMSPILISREVDIKDILIHNECLIFAGQENCDYVDDEAEVWVMNRDPFGIIEIEASNFKVKPGYITNRHYATNPLFEVMEFREYQKYSTSTHCKKPCESKFIRRMIKLEQIINNIRKK